MRYSSAGYPNGPKRPFKRGANRKMANKGKVSETIIDRTNKQYEALKLASIDKVPTPVKIVKVHTDGRVDGFTEKGYLVDYVGVCNGRMVVFDMKECRNEISFPLSNVEPHQYANLKRKHECGAHAFLIVHKVTLKKWYRVPFEVLQRHWEVWKSQDGRAKKGTASIPQSVFESECVELHGGTTHGRMVMLDYLKGLE